MYFQKRNAGREITPSPGGLALIGAGLRGVTSLASEVMNVVVNAVVITEIVRLTEPDVAGDDQRELERGGVGSRPLLPYNPPR